MKVNEIQHLRLLHPSPCRYAARPKPVIQRPADIGCQTGRWRCNPNPMTGRHRIDIP
jgi:hypothetical protein